MNYAVMPFNPIKFIFKLIGTIILILVLIPVSLMLLMYDFGIYQPPITDLEVGGNSFTFETFVSSRINAFLADDTAESIDLGISAPEINALIIETLRNQNQYYLTNQSNDSSLNDYFMQNGPLAFRGVTVSLTDDHILVEAGITANLAFITYRLRLRVGLEVVESSTGIYLAITRLDISNFSIKSAYGLANWITGMFNFNLTDELEGIVPFGTFDAERLKYSITYEELFSLLESDEDSESADLINLLAMLVSQTFGPNELRLFDFGIHASTNPDVRGTANLLLNFGLFRTNQGPFTLTNEITTQAELDKLYSGQTSNLLISALTSNQGTLDLYLNQTVVNQIIHFQMRDSLSISTEFEIGGETYILATEPIFMEFTPNNAYVKMFLTLQKAGDTNQFRSLFTLKTDAPTLVNGTDLAFNVTSISLGDFALDGEFISTIFSLLGSTDMIQGTSIIIPGFTNAILQTGVSIDSIALDNQFLIISISPTDSTLKEIVNQIHLTINSALEEVTQDPAFATVASAVETVNSGSGTPQDIVDAVNNLSLSDQQNFFDQMADYLENSGINLSDLIPVE